MFVYSIINMTTDIKCVIQDELKSLLDKHLSWDDIEARLNMIIKNH